MSKFKHFIAEVTARLNGDKAGVIDAKNAKKAEALIHGQLADQQSKLVKLELKYEDVIDRLREAKYPTVLIGNDQDYINRIKTANDEVIGLSDQLAETEDDQEFFEALLAEFEQGDG